MAQSLRKISDHFMEFCQFMSTPNSKLTETDFFGFFINTSKWRGINVLKCTCQLFATCVSNICLVMLNGDISFDVTEDVNVKLHIPSACQNQIVGDAN